MYTNMMTDWEEFALSFSNLGQNPWSYAGNAWRDWTPTYATKTTQGIDAMVRQTGVLPLSFATIALERAQLMTIGQSWYLQWTKQLTESYLTWLDVQEQAWDWCFSAGAANTPGASSAKALRLKRPSRKESGTVPQVEMALGSQDDSAPGAQAGAEHDDLKRISGIGPGLEKKLNAEGIYRFRQIASLTKSDIARLEQKVIKFPGRIKRDKWVQQAKKLG
jgi:predicted flap endonuclease-1-like 5' DNA nuclease